MKNMKFAPTKIDGTVRIPSTKSQSHRALIGAALSIGANVEIIDTAGYAPLQNDKNMLKLWRYLIDKCKRCFIMNLALETNEC